LQAAHTLLDQLLASDALRALFEFAPQLTATAVEMSAQQVPHAKQMVALGQPATVSSPPLKPISWLLESPLLTTSHALSTVSI
jgi:hypothetical protein